MSNICFINAKDVEYAPQRGALSAWTRPMLGIWPSGAAAAPRCWVPIFVGELPTSVRQNVHNKEGIQVLPAGRVDVMFMELGRKMKEETRNFNTRTSGFGRLMQQKAWQSIWRSKQNQVGPIRTHFLQYLFGTPKNGKEMNRPGFTKQWERERFWWHLPVLINWPQRPETHPESPFFDFLVCPAWRKWALLDAAMRSQLVSKTSALHIFRRPKSGAFS
jgi:hypothetical protein